MTSLAQKLVLRPAWKLRSGFSRELVLLAGLLGGFAALPCSPVPGEEVAPRPTQPEQARGPRFVIVQPGYPGTTRDAEAFVGKLAAHLALKASWPGLAGEYHNEPAPALEAIRRLQPAFGVVSLGFYLEHRRDLALTPLLESRPGEKLVLVSRSGELKDASSLQGQPVAGGPLHELKFLERIAFRGKSNVASWEAKPLLNSSRALRDLVERKKYTAVVLTERDYQALAPLYQTKTVEKALESEYYPAAVLVVFGVKPTGAVGSSSDVPSEKSTVPGDGLKKDEALHPKPEEAAGAGSARQDAATPENVKRLDAIQRAFSELATDPEGKKLLETMGSEGFGALDARALKEVEGKYETREEK